MKYKRNIALQAYQRRLANIPVPGMGLGCHREQMGIANLGRMCGMSFEQVFFDLRHSIPSGGKRDVPDKEIADTVKKAFSESLNPGQYFKEIRKKIQNTNLEYLRTIIIKNERIEAPEIRAVSPISLPSEPITELFRILTNLFDPEEYLFIGCRYDRNVRSVKEILNSIKQNSSIIPEYIIPNPLTGSLGLTKSGTPSYRCDACVANFRFAVAEFDSITKEDQLKFWASVDLPISALIDSGGKSIHAWIRVDCPDKESWQRDVKSRLYDDFLVPLGVDPSCCNPSRLSRLPGHFRQDTGQWQRLIYLCPAGRRVFP